MGSLMLPASGTVYIDTQSLIYTIEPNPAYTGVLRPLWAAVSGRTVVAVSSELALMEVLVKPYRTGNAVIEAAYEQLFASPVFTSLPVTLDVLRSAARLRATVPKLRTPDAVHAATALAAGVNLLVTNDPVFRTVPGLAVEVLDEVIARP